MEAKPMGMFLMMLAGWINRHQQDMITYLKEENRTLREKLGIEIQRIRVSLVQDRATSGWSHWRLIGTGGSEKPVDRILPRDSKPRCMGE